MAKTIYVDASRPDDTGDGLTPETAKKTPWEGQAAAASGDKILLKRGYCYAPGGGVGLSRFFSIEYQNNLEIGTYGTASDKPILDGLTYQNPTVGGWTHVSAGIWKKVFGAFWVRRLWVGCSNNGVLTTQRTVGTAMRRGTGEGLKGKANPSEVAILAALNANDIWYGGGATTSYALYVYTGSTTIDPPTFYDGLAFVQADNSSVGSVDGIFISNQTNIYAHDLHFRGCGKFGVELFARNPNVRDVSDCLFEDLDVTHMIEGAVTSIAGYELSPVRRIRACTFRRILGDSSGSAQEEEPSLDYENMTGIMDAATIAEGSVGITVEDCTFINPHHAGISIHSRMMDSAPPDSCRAINNTIRFDSWNTYGRGFAGMDNAGTTLFQGNLVDGQATRSQFGGTIQVIGNVWKNMRTSTRRPGAEECAIMESYVYDSGISTIGDARYIKIAPVNVLFAHNTIRDAKAPVIGMYFYNSSGGTKNSSYPAGAVTVLNNIAHSPTGKFLSTYEDSGKVIGQQIIQSNCVYNGATGDNKIKWRTTEYAINGAPGCANNAEVDPELDENERPFSAACRRTGSYVGGKDYYGKHFYNPPNIGAVDDITTTPRYVLKPVEIT